MTLNFLFGYFAEDAGLHEYSISNVILQCMKKYEIRKKTKDTLIDHLLFHRGIKSVQEKEQFLDPNYDNHIHDPFLLKDAKKAAKRIIKAIENDEKIVIYSDYDADGIPAGVIFHDFFKKV